MKAIQSRTKSGALLGAILGFTALAVSAGCTNVSVDEDDPNASGGKGASGGNGATGGSGNHTGATGGSSGDGGAGGSDVVWPGERIELQLGADPVWVNLSDRAEVDEAGAWDLRFEQADIYTNSGVSGSGEGGAFGPYPIDQYFESGYPEVPFIMKDKFAGAFGTWYNYDLMGGHILYSNFYTYGIISGGKYYKLQVLSYYGSVGGAPVSAVYSIRYANVSAQGSGTVQVVENLDGTVGGTSGSGENKGTCIKLDSGQKLELTASEAQASSAWDLCFNRTAISVNGGLSGPGGVEAVRLHEGDEIPLAEAKTFTTENTLPAFNAVSFSDLTNPKWIYRGDRVVSAFNDTVDWLETSAPPVPGEYSWLVIGNSGASFLVAFTDITEDAGVWNLTLQVRSLDGAGGAQ